MVAISIKTWTCVLKAMPISFMSVHVKGIFKKVNNSVWKENSIKARPPEWAL